MRIFRKNETFVTIPCKLNDRVKDICQLLAKKLHIQDPSKFGLFIQKLGKGISAHVAFFKNFRGAHALFFGEAREDYGAAPDQCRVFDG